MTIRMQQLALFLVLLLAGDAARAQANHPDLSGTWKLDLGASESVDAIMKRQGISWIKRRVAKTTVVTQTITQSGTTFHVAMKSSVKNVDETITIGGEWQSRDTPEAGKVRTKTAWSQSGNELVTTTEVTLPDGKPAVLLLSRSLEQDGQTLVQKVELRSEGGKDVLAARRVFRKQS